MKTSHKLYSGEIDLNFDAARHIYTINGKPVDSITGVLKVISKPGLVWWSANMAVEHFRRGIIPGVGLDEIQIEELLAGAKSAHRQKSTEAATIGHLIHDFVDKTLKGEEPGLPVNQSARNAAQAFQRFMKDHDFRPMESEQKVYSRKHNVAGTLDMMGYLDGQLAIGDYKSSSDIYPEFLIQTGGYTVCVEEEMAVDVEKNFIVCCTKEGELIVTISDEVERNKQAFLSALNLYRSLESIKKEQEHGRSKSSKN